MWTAEKVREHGDLLFSQILEGWETDGRQDVDPVAFAFVTDEGEDCIVRIPGLENLSKDRIPFALRAFCQMAGIRYVAFCACAVVVEGVPEDALKKWYASGKKLAEHPFAVDNLLLTIDGSGLSVCMRAWWNGASLCREVLDNHGATGPMTNLSGRLGEN